MHELSRVATVRGSKSSIASEPTKQRRFLDHRLRLQQPVYGLSPAAAEKPPDGSSSSSSSGEPGSPASGANAGSAHPASPSRPRDQRIVSGPPCHLVPVSPYPLHQNAYAPINQTKQLVFLASINLYSIRYCILWLLANQDAPINQNAVWYPYHHSPWRDC
ncbi:hypothetical protein G7Z17_g7118 [Cylindrodendrum hubeiense]|uniref:Uncharacterized protein n=1 Tax=Cylindrodendrum hubeiense TaxID=595255 RepID=A0A9P5HDU3_9HYPO|nr:hypothetical protein G7Z17_g7118 [Cylindrodendrum hubeiense]